MRGHTSSFAGALTLLLLGPASDAGAGGAAVEAKDVVGPQECAKCHEEEYREWQETAHAAIFDSPEPLHQRPQAQEIARRLGTVLIKHDSLCLSCHYTPQVKLGRTTAVAGVSCESCHGAARGWLNLHNTFEGRQANRLGESPAQRARREAANAAAGMFAPARSYALVSRCYDCHMVPEERLVEVGGHPGGGGFDLLERFDRIRHGFVSSGRRGNAPLSPEQKRKLFLAAKVLELEHALRNLARATPGGAWASTQAERARRARKALERLDRRVALPLVRTALEATEGLPGSSPRSLALEAAAETLAGAGEAFFATAHPSQLEPLDALLGGSVGTGAEEDAGDAGKGEDEVPTAGGILGEGAQIAPASGEAGAPAPAAGASRTLQQAEGERKKVLRRPVSSTAVVDPSTCTGCHQHAEAARKLRNHPHNTSSDRFFGGGRAAQIAFFYFGKRADGFVAWGSSVCMGCHATVVRGEEGEEVSWGVSCQSCHGGGGDFLKAHQQPGLSRADRLALGIVDLSSPNRRAEVCAGCHYVTDPRLLSSGHGSGSGFDFLGGLDRIRHWDGDPPGPSPKALETAWQAERVRRGAPPRVRVVDLGSRGSNPAASAAVLSRSGPTGVPPRHRGPSTAVRPPLPRPITATDRTGRMPGRGASPRRPLELEPLPADLSSRPLDEVLEEIRRRLAAISSALAGSEP